MYEGGTRERRIIKQGEEAAIIIPNRLSIIGGSAKGTHIDSPDVYLRPMMAKVRICKCHFLLKYTQARKALFSTLEHLDIFSENSTTVLEIGRAHV